MFTSSSGFRSAFRFPVSCRQRRGRPRVSSIGHSTLMAPSIGRRVTAGTVFPKSCYRSSSATLRIRPIVIPTSTSFSNKGIHGSVTSKSRLRFRRPKTIVPEYLRLPIRTRSRQTVDRSQCVRTPHPDPGTKVPGPQKPVFDGTGWRSRLQRS